MPDKMAYLADHKRWICSSGRVFRAHHPTLLVECGIVTGSNGYSLVKTSATTAASVHRLVLLAFDGPPEPDEEARHVNGDRLDNRLSNLAWGTKAENMVDRDEHGRTARGESHGCAKLTAANAREIRSRYARGGLTYVDLAREFDVSKDAIGRVVRADTWKHIGGRNA